MSGCCGPRIINSWGSKTAGAKLEPYQFEAPALGPFGIEIKVKVCGVCGSDVHLWQADGGYKDFTSYESGEPSMASALQRANPRRPAMRLA